MTWKLLSQVLGITEIVLREGFSAASGADVQLGSAPAVFGIFCKNFLRNIASRDIFKLIGITQIFYIRGDGPAVQTDKEFSLLHVLFGSHNRFSCDKYDHAADGGSSEFSDNKIIPSRDFLSNDLIAKEAS
jgi:hypothetical protein